MARFNIEDFLKAAGSVAQGTLQGKLQARQIAEQQRAQQQAQSLQLQQAGAAQDDQQFAQEDAYDQHLLQNVIPRLSPSSQKTALDQINQRKFARQQARAQRQQVRSAMLPPWMQPFFARPATPIGQAPGTTPVNPTQPQTFTGPAATPIQGGTAAALPGGTPTQLPTSPASPAPGTAPPPSYGVPLAPEQALGMPTPEQMGQAPPAPPITPSVAAPAPSTGAAPPPAPGQQPGAPAPNRRITIPGLEGDYEMAGITKEQITDYQKRREQARTLVGGFTGDPATKALLDSAWSQLPANIQTDEDLNRADQLLTRIESERTGNDARAAGMNRLKENDLRGDMEKALEKLRNKDTSPTLGANLVRRILARETDLTKISHFDTATEGVFAGFPDEKKAYDAAIAAKDPKKADQILESVAGSLRNNESDSAHAAANDRVLNQIISNMSSADRNNSKKVAQMARVWGFPEIAARIEKEGVTFGGYRAEKQFYDLLKQAKGWTTLDDTSKDMLLSQLKIAGQQAGMPDDQIQKIVGAQLDRKKTPLTAYQEAMLTDKDRDFEARFGAHSLAERKFNVWSTHMRNLDARAGGQGASLAAKLRGPQHAVDQKWEAYQKVVNKNSLTDDDVKAGDTPMAKQAQGLLKEFNKAYDSWATVYQRELGVDPRTGNTASKSVTNAAAPAGGDAPAVGTRLTPEQRAQWQQRLAKMSPADRLRLLASRQGKH